MFIKFLDHDLRYGIGHAKKALNRYIYYVFLPFDLSFLDAAHF